jgi:transketolase
VETTTGPLGQGVATSVGIALAGKWLAQRYNRPDFTLFDDDVHALAGDGDMMDGIGGEAACLAGYLRLSDLCWIYDNNRIAIEGSTSLAFSEDVAAVNCDDRQRMIQRSLGEMAFAKRIKHRKQITALWSTRAGASSSNPADLAIRGIGADAGTVFEAFCLGYDHP